MVCLSRPYTFNFFKDCFQQILLGPLLNTLSDIKIAVWCFEGLPAHFLEFKSKLFCQTAKFQLALNLQVSPSENYYGILWKLFQCLYGWIWTDIRALRYLFGKITDQKFMQNISTFEY